MTPTINPDELSKITEAEILSIDLETPEGKAWLARIITPKPWKHEFPWMVGSKRQVECARCGEEIIACDDLCSVPPPLTTDLRIVAWDLRNIICKEKDGVASWRSQMVSTKSNWFNETPSRWIRAFLLAKKTEPQKAEPKKAGGKNE